jgi:uncharacterized protein (DUF1501 family)
MKRRDWLRHSLLCGAAAGGLLGPLGMLRRLGGAAQAAGKGVVDYRALVCIYLYGGNDSFNTIVPTDAATHAVYSGSRGGNLVISRAEAQALPLNPLSAPLGGGEYGLHPGMQGLQQLFNNGQCAIVANVGPLTYPITSAQFRSGSVPVPPQLFSHNDQTVMWETSLPDATERTGWGGRTADLLASLNTEQRLSTCISLSGANGLQVGRQVQPYFMGVDGTDSLEFIEGSWNAHRLASFEALQQQAEQPGAHRFERQYAAVMRRARGTHALLSAALAATPAPATVFPDSYLGRQLAMVARLIAARGRIGMSRQLFFVSDGGYDTHDDQLQAQAELLPNLSSSLGAFYDATAELGVADSVTSFTASDFGRTVSVNGDGTDHGWGGHHFVIGGAVRGRRFVGSMPNLQSQGPDDAAWGQIVPTTSVDQYAGTLARWMGVADTEVRSTVVPNIGRFGEVDPYLALFA